MATLLIEVESSNISQIGYDEEDSSLFVYMKRSPDTFYVYKDVTPITFVQFKLAESKGKYFLENIKGKYEYEKYNKVTKKVV